MRRVLQQRFLDQTPPRCSNAFCVFGVNFGTRLQKRFLVWRPFLGQKALLQPVWRFFGAKKRCCSPGRPAYSNDFGRSPRFARRGIFGFLPKSGKGKPIFDTQSLTNMIFHVRDRRAVARPFSRPPAAAGSIFLGVPARSASSRP